MRVLWLSMNSGLFCNPKENRGYNGIGWISSLQQIVQNVPDIKLGFVFLTHVQIENQEQNGTHYYPIHSPELSFFQKIRRYYGGYKKPDSEKYLGKVNQIIEDFKPDIIHVFGIENNLAKIVGRTDIPVVIHLQGLLAPYDNAFFPVGINKTSFLYPFSINEWILRNGYIHAKNSIHFRGQQEIKLFKYVKYTMGRTHWDYQVSRLLAPSSAYFHVDEVLRDIFYVNKGKWRYDPNRKFIIVSTVSETLYKGIDLILKTAALLKEHTDLDFEWKVIGVNPKSKIVRFIERVVGIRGLENNVNYSGVMTAEELCETELSASVYVHPSYIDNSPNSICEAQLLGLPVVATYVGGVETLLKEVDSGILVPANSPYELSYILKNLFANQDYIQRLSETGKKVADRRHDVETIKINLLHTYKCIVSENSR